MLISRSVGADGAGRAIVTPSDFCLNKSKTLGSLQRWVHEFWVKCPRSHWDMRLHSPMDSSEQINQHSVAVLMHSKGLAPPDFQTFRRLWSRVRSENPLFNCAVNPHQDSSCPTLYCPPLPFFQNTLPWISVIDNIHTYSLSRYNNIVNCDSLKSK